MKWEYNNIGKCDRAIPADLRAGKRCGFCLGTQCGVGINDSNAAKKQADAAFAPPYDRLFLPGNDSCWRRGGYQSGGYQNRGEACRITEAKTRRFCRFGGIRHFFFLRDRFRRARAWEFPGK